MSHDIIIVGGGISGLSLSHYASRAGMRVLVIEKSPIPGGCLRTRRTDSFWLELGAHTCYNSYGNLIGILEASGLMDRLRERSNVSFKMLTGTGVKSIPSQLNWAELFCSAPNVFFTKKAGMTVEGYYSKIAGKKNFERVIGPALCAVPSQRANDFPAGMLFKKRPRRKDVIKKFTLKGGLQTIAETLAGSVEFMSGAEVKSMAKDGSVFRVAVEGKGEFEAGSLALAVPPSKAAILLKESFPAVSGKLARIKVVNVESIGVVVKKERTRIPEFAGLIPVNDIFYSVVSRDIVPDDALRGFCFHFKPGSSKDAKTAKISGVLGTNSFEDIAENTATLPSPVLGHEGVAADIDRLIDGERLLITGNYFSGLAIEDCVSRSLGEWERLKKIL